MATSTFTIRGDQLGRYANLSASGNNADRVVTLRNTRVQGTADERLTVTVEQVNTGETQFRNGQFVTIRDAAGNIVMPRTGVNPDAEQGAAAGDEYIIFGNSRYVIDFRGIAPGNQTLSFRNGDGNGDPAQGDNDSELDFQEAIDQGAPPVICFAAQGRIATANRPLALRELRPGMHVQTRDNGLKQVRWIGWRTVAARGGYAPVRIPGGVMGAVRDTYVSPQHRLLLDDTRLALRYGNPEYLCAAVHLCGDLLHRAQDFTTITYVHVLLDNHQIVNVDGLWSESLFLGPQTERILKPAQLHQARASVTGAQTLVRAQMNRMEGRHYRARSARLAV